MTHATDRSAQNLYEMAKAEDVAAWYAQNAPSRPLPEPEELAERRERIGLAPNSN